MTRKSSVECHFGTIHLACSPPNWRQDESVITPACTNTDSVVPSGSECNSISSARVIERASNGAKISESLGRALKHVQLEQIVSLVSANLAAHDVDKSVSLAKAENAPSVSHFFSRRSRVKQGLPTRNAGTKSLPIVCSATRPRE